MKFSSSTFPIEEYVKHSIALKAAILISMVGQTFLVVNTVLVVGRHAGQSQI